MVLGGRLETVRGRRREIIGVAAEYFKNLGNSMFFKSFDPTSQGVSQYKFFFDLRAPNYAPVAPLPTATIRSDSKLESMHLVNVGFGSAFAQEYTVILGQRDDLRLFYEIRVETLTRGVLLNNSYYITRLSAPIPAPTSLLL